MHFVLGGRDFYFCISVYFRAKNVRRRSKNQAADVAAPRTTRANNCVAKPLEVAVRPRLSRDIRIPSCRTPFAPYLSIAKPAGILIQNTCRTAKCTGNALEMIGNVEVCGGLFSFDTTVDSSSLNEKC